MTTKERIFQAILFEVLAVLLTLGLVKVLSQFGLGGHDEPSNQTVLMMLIGISLMAMCWTFVYNLIFDKIFTGDKLARPVWLRVVHIVVFELGLLCFTLPLVMWVMQIGLWQAFLLDISMTLLVLVYGFVFYWVYDVVGAKLKVN
ncbi:PACE efflux transporter [Faucicola mancuniensis]|uniref:PACE efflux transporter n=1 Tax=Faucicola mancuniensis TaxID=1309795 RepID=UPI0039778C49